MNIKTTENTLGRFGFQMRISNLQKYDYNRRAFFLVYQWYHLDLEINNVKLHGLLWRQATGCIVRLNCAHLHYFQFPVRLIILVKPQ